jgi:hypothetical protein
MDLDLDIHFGGLLRPEERYKKLLGIRRDDGGSSTGDRLKYL